MNGIRSSTLRWLRRLVKSCWVLSNKIRLNCNNRNLFSKCDDIFVPVKTGKTLIQLNCVRWLTYVDCFFFSSSIAYQFITWYGNWQVKQRIGCGTSARLTNGRYQMWLMSCMSGICERVLDVNILPLAECVCAFCGGARWTTNSLDDANFGFYICANKTGHYWHQINDFISTE